MFLIIFQHFFRLEPQLLSEPLRLQHFRLTAEAQYPLQHIGIAGKVPFKQQAVPGPGLIAVGTVFLYKTVFLMLMKQGLEAYPAR